MYHVIDAAKKAPVGNDTYTQREFLIDKLVWKNGWPVRFTPSFNPTTAPVITDKKTFRNPLLSSGPDPWALWHDSCYYYVNTSQDCIVLKRTKDITDLRNAESKTVWRPDQPSYAKDVWAPEIHFLNGKWYLLFAADDGNTDNHQLYCAENTSADPFKGEFKMKGRVSTDKDNNWAIDGTYLEHNGKLYMFWSGWKTRRVSTETQCIWIAEMENPWTLKSERIKISEPELEWERIYKNPDGWTPPYIIYVNEGPQPLKNPEGDKIFLIYSASGCWTPHYQLGMLCADANADLLDPASWTKSSHSVFRQALENSVYGTGHNSFFKSPDGTEDWILYHGWDTETDPEGEGDTRAPRAQKITWENGYPVFGKPFPNAMILDKPSGTVSTRK
ncbi:MAG: glycoside hydrolase family 43 protein [Parabacteroides sp.]|nr:glycoside hydrolase family 43 protein [Parabacteroides sp.]